MTAVAETLPAARPRRARQLDTLAALASRRFALTTRTPRELVVPLFTPVLFALVIAPALADTVGRFRAGLDYMTFVAIATAGLLVPLNTMFSGIGVIVDRESGARRDLLAAPIPRSLVVLGNLAVAITVSPLQVAALIAAGWLRGS